MIIKASGAIYGQLPGEMKPLLIASLFWSNWNFTLKGWIKGQIVRLWQYATIGSQLDRVNLTVVYPFYCILVLFSASHPPTRQHNVQIQLQHRSPCAGQRCASHQKNQNLSPCVTLCALALSWWTVSVSSLCVGCVAAVILLPTHDTHFSDVPDIMKGYRRRCC